MKTLGKWLAFCLMLAMMQIEGISNDTVRMTWLADGGSKSFSFMGTKDANFIIDWGDGNTETITATGNKKSCSHTYADMGTYEVLLLGQTDTARILELNCSYVEVKALNVKTCTALISLSCWGNQLSSLDISNNTALTSLDCWSNQLFSLDVNNNAVLTSLNCSMNQLPSIEISNNTALTKLNCSNNRIFSLDVSDNTALTSLICANNHMSSMDVHNNTSLTYLDCSTNHLSSIDVSNNTALTELNCRSNRLVSLDVSNNTALTSLTCANNQLPFIDISKNTALNSLDCSNNRFTAIDVSNNTALGSLDCSNNQLTSIDVRPNLQLRTLDCAGNKLGVWENIRFNEALTSLNCSNNGLTSIDVSKNTALTGLDCSNNQLTKIDVGNNTALTILKCSGNQLASLDISNNALLKVLHCSSNQLTSLDVTSNSKLFALDCSGNNFGLWQNIHLNESVTTLYCSDNHFSSIDVSENIALSYLNCSGNQITSLDVSNNTALGSLDCSNNQLTSLDVTSNSKLTTLYCSGNKFEVWENIRFNETLMSLDCSDNQLNYIDVSRNATLIVLSCANNQLSSIDVSANTALSSLICSDNPLLTLDVSSNIALSVLYCNNTLLAALDIRSNPELTGLNISNTSIATLDLTKQKKLIWFESSNSSVRSLNINDTTFLTDLRVEDSRLPLQTVNHLLKHYCYTMVVNYIHQDSCFLTPQADTLTLEADSEWSLQSEMTIAGVPTLWAVRKASGEEVAENTYTEQNGVFTFHRSGKYELRLRNPQLRNLIAGEPVDTVEFTWRITVKGGLPEVDSLTVCLVSNPVDGGVLTGNGKYEKGESVTITATANTGYHFVNWTKGSEVFSTEAVHTFAVSEDLTLTANFEELPVVVETFTVSVSENNTAWGRVSITGGGEYEAGESVTITATASAGYRFVNWTKGNEVFSTEAVHTFAVSEDLTLTANFEARPADVETYTVSVASNNTAWGRASITGGGEYEAGESVTITATASAGYRFVNWTKGNEVFSTEAVHTFAVSEDLTLTANFEKDNVANEPVDNMDAGYVYSKDFMIYLSEDMGEVQVYNVSGTCVFSGYATVIPVKSSGLYIVKTARRHFKVMVR